MKIKALISCIAVLVSTVIITSVCCLGVSAIQSTGIWSVTDSENIQITGDADEGFSFSVPNAASARYNTKIDMKKGILFKVSEKQDWFAFSVESSLKDTYGELDKPLPSGKRIYVMYPKDGKLIVKMWYSWGDGATGGVADGEILDVDFSKDIRIKYVKGDDSYWRLYVGDQCALWADALSNDEFTTLFDNGNLYPTFTTNGETAVFKSVRAYTEKLTDWTATNQNTVINGDIQNGFSFDLGSENYARYNTTVNLTEGIPFKVKSEADFFYLAFEGTIKDNTGSLDNPVPDDKIIYILTPHDGNLTVQIWSGTAAVGTYEYTGFDMTESHMYKFQKNEKGDLWYFYIDNKIAMTASSVPDSDYNVINNNGAGAYVTFGSWNGTMHFTDVLLPEEPAPVSEKNKDWEVSDTSLKITGTLDEGYDFLSETSGYFGRLNKSLDMAKGIQFSFTPNQDGWLYLGLSENKDEFDLSNPLPKSNYTDLAKIFILTKVGSDLKVDLWIPSNGAVATLGFYRKFDFSAQHIYKYVKGADGNWRMKIDNNEFGADSITDAEFHSFNKDGMYLTVGSLNGVTVKGLKCVDSKTPIDNTALNSIPGTGNDTTAVYIALEVLLASLLFVSVKHKKLLR